MTIFRNFHQSEIAVSNYSFEPLFEELKIVIMDVLDLLLKQQQKKKQKQKKNCDYSRDTIFEGIYRDDTTLFKTPPYLKFLNVFRRSSFPVKVSLPFLFC